LATVNASAKPTYTAGQADWTPYTIQPPPSTPNLLPHRATPNATLQPSPS
jgi:hypothetical protein